MSKSKKKKLKTAQTKPLSQMSECWERDPVTHRMVFVPKRIPKQSES